MIGLKSEIMPSEMGTNPNHEERRLQRTESGVLVALLLCLRRNRTKQTRLKCNQLTVRCRILVLQKSSTHAHTADRKCEDNCVQNRSEGEISGLVRLRSSVEWQASRGWVTMHKEARDVRHGM